MSARVLQAPTPPNPQQLKRDDSLNLNHLPSPAHSSTSVNNDMNEATMHSPREDPHPLSDEDEYGDSDDGFSDVDEEENIVHVEVRQSADSTLLPSLLGPNVSAMLREHYESLRPGTIVPDAYWAEIGVLRDAIDRIHIAQTHGGREVPISQAVMKVHAYTAQYGAGESLGCALDDDDDSTTAASVTYLPSGELEGLWETLIYEDGTKERMLDYIQTSMVFAAAELDTNVISWNRLILLYGPPGTGKTSLCRALAHKASIRMSEHFKRGILIEINSHSLFSKWFSESGKLVQKLFDRVHDYAADPESFVTVMIDEVESLTAARAGAMNGSEPGDALRVVNALLTQLDKLKQLPNVLVMATSNLAGSIDGAFIDRSDIKQYIGLPSSQAVYWILSSCLSELGACGLATGASRILPYSELPHHLNPQVEEAGMTPFPNLSEIIADAPPGPLLPTQAERNLEVEGTSSGKDKRRVKAEQASASLQELAERCTRMRISGRLLRRLPLIAHSRYLRSGTGIRVERWIHAFGRCIDDEAESMDRIAKAEGRKK